MIVATVWNQSCAIRSRGSATELRNRNTNSSGKAPWTASALPVRSPIVEPDRAEGDETRHASASSDERAGDAGFEVGAEGQPDRPGTPIA